MIGYKSSFLLCFTSKLVRQLYTHFISVVCKHNVVFHSTCESAAIRTRTCCATSSTSPRVLIRQRPASSTRPPTWRTTTAPWRSSPSSITSRRTSRTKWRVCFARAPGWRATQSCPTAVPPSTKSSSTTSRRRPRGRRRPTIRRQRPKRYVSRPVFQVPLEDYYMSHAV